MLQSPGHSICAIDSTIAKYTVSNNTSSCLHALFPMQTLFEEFPWFALVVRNRWEKCAAQCLACKGYECLLPISRQRHRWSDRWKELDVALFPGYLFCRFDPTLRVPVLSVPGVLSIVGTKAGLTPVRCDEIATMKAVGLAGVPAQPWPFMETGRVVNLNQGPLRGLGGIVLECKERSKLIISVTLLMRSIAVEIDRSWIGPPPVERGARAVDAANVSILDFKPARPEPQL